MTPHELSDHLEITQLLYRYARGIDTRDLDLLDAVFAPDADIHYDVPGGTRLPWSEMKRWLAAVLPLHRITQHAMTNPLVELDGDRARTTTYLSAAHVQQLRDGRLSYVLQHAVYADELARTPSGWRITRRRLDNLHIEGRFHGPDAVVLFPKPEPSA